MMPKRDPLVRLVRANVSFLLYGQKASGKTTLVHSVFKEADAKFIEINCTLANKRSNFLKLFNVELYKYLHARNMRSQKMSSPHTLDSWIGDIKKSIHESPSLVQELDCLYIFMDNIQEMVMSESFVPSFYTACQKQFPFKFSFVFCGTNFLKKEYSLELPFRTLISFCMPKPMEEYQSTIQKVVYSTLKDNYKERVSQQSLDKCCKTFSAQIKASFDNIELNLDKIKSITKAIVEVAINSFDQKDLSKSLTRMINIGDLKSIIQQVKEHGPMQETLMKRKINAIQNEEPYDPNPNLQFYPSLILTSIHLADYYQEKEDKRRFHDYKSRTHMRNKDMKRNDFKIGRHNVNRIIAIADALESQARENDKEKVLEHHSLDFYSQFEHLRKIQRLKYTGTKITGVVKEEEAKAFLAKNQLRYDQFMSS